jgi:CubicO group peptidase (beta-lactamase class C family)
MRKKTHAASVARPGALVAALFAAMALSAGAARAQPADVSQTLTPILKKHDIPGMAVLVLHGPEEVARGAAGVRKAGDPTPATIDNQWHLGSCTKSMTATMIATLVEEGKLSWGTTLGDVFGDLDGKLDPAWKDVTLELLLKHRAGVPSDLSKDGLWAKLGKREGTPTQQRMQLVEGVLSKPPVHKPGTEFLYANAGFAIAGAMAEKVTRVAWEDLMRRRLFEPLGMKSAGFGAPGWDGPIVRVSEKGAKDGGAGPGAASAGGLSQPWGHHENGKPEAPGPHADNPAAIGPGGTVRCTIEDWGKYIATHLEGEDPKKAPGLAVKLTPETWVTLHTPFKGPGSEYAMGWGVATRGWAKGAASGDSGRVLTHNGSNTMWFCVAWLAPEKDWAVLACCNKGGDEAGKACDEAVAAMVGRYVAGAK